MLSFQVERTPLRFYPDNTRTITLRFSPSGVHDYGESKRLTSVLNRILELAEEEVSKTLEIALLRFGHRHQDFIATLESNFSAVAYLLRGAEDISTERRRLIGAYLTQEYSVEGAALSNPSIVLAPDQSGLGEHEARVVLSLRSIGDGHISSIQFRTGRIDATGTLAIDRPGRHPGVAHHELQKVQKAAFRAKVAELELHGSVATRLLERLPDEFTVDQLNAEIENANNTADAELETSRVTRGLRWLAASNYHSWFPPESDISERVLFPALPTLSSGMEDARFTRFVYEDGTVTYFATYTAYDGHHVLPQLIETTDFLKFRTTNLDGACAKNRGIALFPRRVNGKFLALSRIDSENNFLMTSDNVHVWHTAKIIQGPRRPWELTHIGNCGSPLETEAGWLVITHGVGPMRRYALGATLLDLQDPSRVLGTLREPLLEPEEGERDGYVPNVVYSCGSMIQGKRLILPYGFSDRGTGVATLLLRDLLDELQSPQSAVN